MRVKKPHRLFAKRMFSLVWKSAYNLLHIGFKMCTNKHGKALFPNESPSKNWLTLQTCFSGENMENNEELKDNNPNNRGKIIL